MDAGLSVGRRAGANRDERQRNFEMLESFSIKRSRRKRLFLVVELVDLRIRSRARLATRSSSISVLSSSLVDLRSFSTATLVFISSDHCRSLLVSDTGRSNHAKYCSRHSRASFSTNVFK